jgi:hypothetical protein
LSRIRTLVAVLAIALPVPIAVAGCGGGSSSNSEDPQQVLDQTFNNPTKVNSGNLDISLTGSAEGAQSGSASANITGPFQSDANNPNAFPQLDLTAKITASGAGQSFNFDGSLIATKDNAYVVYQDTPYEVGTALFKQFASAYEQSVAQQKGQSQGGTSIFKQFGIDPSTWLTNVSNEGETDVNGTTTIHIHGDANVPKIVADFGKIAQQTPGGTAQSITPAQINQLKSAIKDASVDVYSGTSDHLLNKLSLSLTIAPPASAGSPVSSVNIDFSVAVSDINQPQTISAPSNPKPIAGLLGQLGLSGLGPLGAIGAGSSANGGATPALPGGGGGPAQAYTKCLQQATTPADLNKCAQKLQGG